jgi:hypothetical protein
VVDDYLQGITSYTKEAAVEASKSLICVTVQVPESMLRQRERSGQKEDRRWARDE